MADYEVFRPSNGPLHVPNSLQGAQMDTNSFKKPGMEVFRPATSRPATQGGYRFGKLSHNSFFTRHNPHPAKVRHIKGLLDVPICAVNDNGFVANPKYSLNIPTESPKFPPDNYNKQKLSQYIPVNAINVTSQLHPINTLTGLQNFTGLQSGPFREKAVPSIGLVPVTETWRDELRNLTEAAGLLAEEKKRDDMRRDEEKIKQKSVYSSETGRLLPPPSRAMTRQGSRQASRNQMNRYFEHISEQPDMETTVLQMLCQILQTDDVNAVQAWLCSAGDREKHLVLDLIKSAIAGKDDYYKQYNTEYVEPERPMTGAVNQTFSRPATAAVIQSDTVPKFHDHAQETNTNGEEARIAQIERMSFDRISPRGGMNNPENQINQWTRYSWTPHKANSNIQQPRLSPKNANGVARETIPENGTAEFKPPKADVFRVKHSPRERPPTSQLLKVDPPKPSYAKPLLRLSTPTKKNTDTVEQTEQIMNSILLEKKWEPEKSTVN